MPEPQDNSSKEYEYSLDDIERAEELFLGLIKTPDAAGYAGQAAHLPDIELRALFGLSLAAWRSMERQRVRGRAAAARRPEAEPPAPRHDSLESHDKESKPSANPSRKNTDN